MNELWNEKRTDGKQPGAKFKKGNPGGGRPSKPKEEAYLAVLREAVKLDDFKRLIQRAYLDSIGAKVVKDEEGKQKIVDDENSTAQGRSSARKQLMEYLIGRAPQYIKLGDSDPFSRLADMGDDELENIIRLSDAINEHESDANEGDT